MKEVAEKANKISQKKIKMLPKILDDPKKYGSVHLLLFSFSFKNFFIKEDMIYLGIYSGLINFLFKIIKQNKEDFLKVQQFLCPNGRIQNHKGSHLIESNKFLKDIPQPLELV